MDIQWLKNIFEKIVVNLDFRRVNSPSTKVNVKTEIESKAENVGTQIAQVNIHGLTYSEAKDLIHSIVDQKLIAFKDQAERIYEERVNDFKKLLTEKIKDLPEDEIAKLKEPDAQLTLIEAAKISGRKQNEELRNLLAGLVINRIKNDKAGKEELKNIVYNEAISTINKLTIDQLKIITLFYLLRYVYYKGIVSWETFNNYLNTIIKPFLNFKNTESEFQHIEYAGCGSIGMGSINLLMTIIQQHTFLFLDPVQKYEIDNLDIPVEIKNEIVVLNETEQTYSLRIRNKFELVQYLKEKHLGAKIAKKLTQIYESTEGNMKNYEVMRNKILQSTEVGAELLNKWENSKLSNLSLTSVGIAIGASYFEQITGVKLDIDLWIN